MTHETINRRCCSFCKRPGHYKSTCKDKLSDFELEMIQILENLTNSNEPEEREEIEYSNELMIASLENDIASAILFNDMMLHINYQRERLRALEINKNIEILVTKENKLNKGLRKKEECNICYEKQSKCNFINLNCNHNFCKDCIKQLITINIEKNKCCPFCRGKISKIETNTYKIQKEFVKILHNDTENINF